MFINIRDQLVIGPCFVTCDYHQLGGIQHGTGRALQLQVALSMDDNQNLSCTLCHLVVHNSSGKQVEKVLGG